VSFFSKIGKAIKKVVKVALPIVKFGAAFIPGVGGIASKVLSLGAVSKGVHLAGQLKRAGRAFKRGTMPGGATIAPPATPTLRMEAGASVGAMSPLLAMKHSRTLHKVGSTLKRRRKSTTKRKTLRKAIKRRTKGRKLKFGSPAWRKKYLKKRR